MLARPFRLGDRTLTRFIGLCSIGFWMALLLALPLEGARADKIPITKQEDLPRRVYEIAKAPSSLLSDPTAFGDLSARLRADVESDLETYDVQDKTTLKSLHMLLLNLDIVDGRFDSALQHVAIVRELEDKPAEKLTFGLAFESMIAASRVTGSIEDSPRFAEAFREEYGARIAALPWSVVEDPLQQMKGQLSMISENLILGLLQSQLDPVAAESGELSFPMASELANFYTFVNHGLFFSEEIVSVLDTAITSNTTEKENIWPKRDLDLAGQQGLEPVRIAIWDTGVDPSVFSDRLFVNPKEIENGKDDDGNGFVDDLHGFAFDLEWRPATSPLYLMDEATRPIPELQANAKGLFDLQAAIPSEESNRFQKAISGLAPTDVGGFIEDMGRYTMYAHGTHVAGIAIEGNPAAHVLIARLTANVESKPPVPTREDALRAEKAIHAGVEYFKANGVRVVNMSWTIERKTFEQELEQNGIGTAEERKAMARELFDIHKRAFESAFRSAPEILFVGAAGNDDNDVAFEELVPPMLELPNLIIAGAVDQTGGSTGFTSFGPTVAVYSNGFEVESFVPGGDRIAFSGTSMSAPNVANLAGKLIALDPTLMPAEVIDLIVRGSEVRREGDQELRIIHPKNSSRMLETRNAG